jgi:hypothetical protein
MKRFRGLASEPFLYVKGKTKMVTTFTGSHHLLKNYDVIFKVLALGSKTVILLFFL